MNLFEMISPYYLSLLRGYLLLPPATAIIPLPGGGGGGGGFKIDHFGDLDSTYYKVHKKNRSKNVCIKYTYYN